MDVDKELMVQIDLRRLCQCDVEICDSWLCFIAGKASSVDLKVFPFCLKGLNAQ